MTTAELLSDCLNPRLNAHRLAKTIHIEPDRTHYKFHDGSKLMIERSKWVHMPRVVVVK